MTATSSGAHQIMRKWGHMVFMIKINNGDFLFDHAVVTCSISFSHYTEPNLKIIVF